MKRFLVMRRGRKGNAEEGCRGQQWGGKGPINIMLRKGPI